MSTKKRKPTKVPAGIHLKRSAKGFSAHIHADNGNKLAAMTGYNTKASVFKALLALNRILNASFTAPKGDGTKHVVIDHTVKKR